jgi:hypothetical protein
VALSWNPESESAGSGRFFDAKNIAPSLRFQTKAAFAAFFLAKKKPKNLTVFGLIFFLWPELESNQRHKDFQSSALPTELSGLMTGERG